MQKARLKLRSLPLRFLVTSLFTYSRTSAPVSFGELYPSNIHGTGFGGRPASPRMKSSSNTFRSYPAGQLDHQPFINHSHPYIRPSTHQPVLLVLHCLGPALKRVWDSLGNSFEDLFERLSKLNAAQQPPFQLLSLKNGGTTTRWVGDHFRCPPLVDAPPVPLLAALPPPGGKDSGDK